MQAFLNPTGAVSGVIVGVIFIVCWRFLRRRFLVPTALVGFLILAYTLYQIVILTWAWLVMRNEPLADMGPFWGLLALALGIVLAFCAVTAAVQSARSTLPWWKLFGAMIAEAGVAIGVGILANEFLYPLADMLRHGSRDIPQILHSQEQARNLLGMGDFSLFWTLVLWEFVSPFFRRLSSLPMRERRSPEANASPA